MPHIPREQMTSAIVLACLALIPQTSVGQDRALGVVGGAWQYDLSGTGTSGFGGLRLELPVAQLFVIEPGLTYARYSSQFGPSVNYLIPELQAQIQVPGSTVRPFLGGGIGLAHAWAEGDHASDLSLSAGIGTRIRLATLWSARAELRVRSIDPFHGTVAEWTAGIARRF
jgi:outer membrane protein with beta-barrel domain